MKKNKFNLLITCLALLGTTGCGAIEKTSTINSNSTVVDASSTYSMSEDEQLIYNIYLKAAQSGYTGTYQEWLASIKGDKGDTGETGAQGEKGEKGDKGENGKDGADGLTPYIGDNGNWWIGSTDTGVKAGETDYKVSFDANGGILPDNFSSTLTVQPGYVFSNLPIPTKNDKVFLGWFTGWTINDTQITTITPIHSDIQLIAKWDSYDISFYDNQNEVVDKITVQPNGKAYSSTAIPTKTSSDGYYYTFESWILILIL